VLDEVRELLEQEKQARNLVAEGASRARAIREGTARQHAERLARAKDEAKAAAGRCRTRILEESDPICQTTLANGEKRAEALREAAKPNIEAAVNAALQWLVYMETPDAGRG
jgi:vacuolar-type H+-ATPase subunit E/Vma4